MPLFSPFSQWYLLTREKALSGPNARMINDATKHTYVIGKMVKGRPDKVLQGGSFITEFLQLLAANTFHTYQPGQTRQVQRSTGAVQIKFPWRFTEASTGTTDAETMTNEGDEYTRWKRLAESLDQLLYTDVFNGMETMLWQQPDGTNMELLNTSEASPGKINSIPAFITESAKRAPGYGNTVGQVNPDTYANWDNQRVSYSSALPYGIGGIFAAFDQIMMKLAWDQGFSRTQYVENDDLGRLMIHTNTNGRAMYMQGLRNANDRTTAGPQDPAYGKPVWFGVPIDWASELDTALLAETGGSYDNTAYPDGKPRFYFTNANYLYPVFHNDRYMKRKVVPGGPTQHDTESVFVNTWYNLVCTSRRRQGIVYPA